MGQLSYCFINLYTASRVTTAKTIVTTGYHDTFPVAHLQYLIPADHQILCPPSTLCPLTHRGLPSARLPNVPAQPLPQNLGSAHEAFSRHAGVIPSFCGKLVVMKFRLVQHLGPRYDTRCYFNVHQGDMVSLIYHTEPKTK